MKTCWGFTHPTKHKPLWKQPLMNDHIAHRAGKGNSSTQKCFLMGYMDSFPGRHLFKKRSKRLLIEEVGRYCFPLCTRFYTSQVGHFLSVLSLLRWWMVEGEVGRRIAHQPRSACCVALNEAPLLVHSRACGEQRRAPNIYWTMRRCHMSSMVSPHPCIRPECDQWKPGPPSLILAMRGAAAPFTASRQLDFGRGSGHGVGDGCESCFCWSMVSGMHMRLTWSITSAPKQSKIETSSARHWPDLLSSRKAWWSGYVPSQAYWESCWWK